MPGTILIGVDVESVSESSRVYAERGAEFFASEGVPVTWYLTGRTLEEYPDDFARVERSGAVDIQSHTYEHILLKTVLMEIPKGLCIHDRTDWYLVKGGSAEEIDKSLERCQKLFEDVLGRRAIGLTGPYGYYRGLGDRLDLLEIVHRHGFRFLRTYARDARDGQPVPVEVQPYFYKEQGFPDILEIGIQGYQDDGYYVAFNPREDVSTYPAYLRQVADRVAKEDLVWSLCTHDHGCPTPEAFAERTSWLLNLIRYARSLGIRFMTGSAYYAERAARESAAKR
jgi:peptidoglycan/xylan/chitin deacetylase (PgdA/CDA1 family)